MQQLEFLRRRFSVILIASFWLNLPLLALIGWLAGSNAKPALIGALVLVGATTIIWFRDRSGPFTRLFTGITGAALPSFFVLLLDGHPWQADMHMYFFAMLAILAGWCDWRVLLVNSALIAAHHLILNFVYPSAIYPGGADLGRVVLHAVIVLVQFGILVWLTRYVVAAFIATKAALDSAQAAKREANAAAEEARSAAAREREQMMQFARLAPSFDTSVRGAVRNCSDAIELLGTTAGAVAGSARQGREQTDRILTAAQTASGAMQGIFHAAGELESSIRSIRLSGEAVATVGSEASQRMDEAMAKVVSLVERTQSIRQVVDLIRSIASKTNLLALNATIEAARAGEAGRGFSIVAQEVKMLANQTADATKGITSEAESISASSGNATEEIARARAVVRQLAQNAAAIATAIEHQSTTTAEITRNIAAAANRANEVAVTIGDMRGIIGEVDAAATKVDELSHSLRDEASGLGRAVDGFVASIPTAA